MKRFAEFHTDLTANPRRRLIREGVVARQATFKQVDRTLFLFNDCLLITDAASTASMLVQKQLLDLRSVVIQDANGANTKAKRNPNAFDVLTPQRDFSFICRDADDKAQWTTAIRDAAAAHKLSGDSGTLGAAVKGKVFGLGNDGEGYDGRLLSTTVHSAVRDGKDDILLYLLSERGEDPNTVDADGATPLQYAIRYRNAFAVSLLIAHGADLTHTDAHRNTPLHLAANNADFGTAMILISKGAAVTAVNEDGLTPLWLLCTTTIDGALAENDVDAVDTGSGTDTTDEASADHSLRDDLHSYHARAVMDMIGMMVDAGADVDCHDAKGESLLVRLCRLGQWEAIMALLTKSASLTAIDEHGRSPLHIAAAFAPPTLDGASAVVGAALARTAAMNIPASPAYNHVNAVKALLSAGAAPNIRDHNGNTALHLTSNVLVSTTLIAHGARTDLKNTDGRRATEHFEDKRNFSKDDGVAAAAAAAIKAARDDFISRTDTSADDDALSDEADWIGDDQIESCLLCALPFTLLSRRHHCRSCGLLCCAQCSTKKAATQTAGAVRVCDACYNRLSDLALTERRRRRHARMAELAKLKAQNDALKAETQREQQRIDKANAAQREAKLAALREKAAATRTAKAAPSSSATAKSTAGLAATMGRNRDALDARGRQLSELSDKAASMEDDANTFANKARALREKAEKNNKFWPF